MSNKMRENKIPQLCCLLTLSYRLPHTTSNVRHLPSSQHKLHVAIPLQVHILVISNKPTIATLYDSEQQNPTPILKDKVAGTRL